MSLHNETGRKGEQLAARFLEQKGFRILARNWQQEKAEIDLIAKEEDTLVFVEVKTRTGAQFGYPEEAVTPAKQEHLCRAAEAYLETHPSEKEIRFDIVSITLTDPEPVIYHIRDAFFPYDA